MAPVDSSALRLTTALEAAGLEAEVRTFAASTRTSAEAAAAIGCEVAQIAKSIVFKAKPSGRPVLVIASGVNRVDEAKISRHLGEALGKADAEFVRARTGFAIGGVPPAGHTERVVTYIDCDLLALGEIWAAAGTPHSVVRLKAEDLVRLTQGHVLEVRAAR